MAGRPITVEGFMEFLDGRVVPVEQLTPEERAYCRQSMTERLSRVVSEYYSLHPEEYAKLK